nr:unnamed protein product [Callosobruchus chinensis]
MAHISGELLLLLPCLYLMQSREGQLNSSVTALTCYLQPLSDPRAIGDLPLFYGCSKLTSIILDAPAGLLQFTPRGSFFIHQKPSSTTAPLSPGCPGPGMDCLVMYLLSLRALAYSSPALTNLP